MFATRDGHGSRAGGTGGSNCGLAAAAGVMTWLAGRDWAPLQRQARCLLWLKSSMLHAVKNCIILV